MDLQRLVAQQLPHLNRYARHLSRNRIPVEDLVQDTMLRALSRLELWQAGTDLRAWLFTIMHNEYVNHVRRSIREASRFSEEEPNVAIGGGQEGSVEFADLAQAFAKLPRDQQAIIRLIAIDGMSYGEAAALLGMPVGTVRSRLSRGRQRLRDLIEGRVTPRPLRRPQHLPLQARPERERDGRPLPSARVLPAEADHHRHHYV